MNELYWEVTGVEDARDQICSKLTSEAELQEVLSVVDDHIRLVIEEHGEVQDRVFKVQRICTFAPRYYPDNEEVAFAAEGLYHSSSLAMLLVDGLISDLEQQRALLYFLHQPLSGFSTFPLELQFLCNNAHNSLIDMVKQSTFELFQVVAPYTEETRQFFLLLEATDPLPEPEPRRKQRRPNMVEYEPYSAPT